MNERLARRRLESLQEQIERNTPDLLAWLEDRLDQADKISEEDPEAARGIRQGVVDLHGDKPWAAEVVDRARRALAGQASADDTATAQKP